MWSNQLVSKFLVNLLENICIFIARIYNLSKYRLVLHFYFYFWIFALIYFMAYIPRENYFQNFHRLILNIILNLSLTA